MVHGRLEAVQVGRTVIIGLSTGERCQQLGFEKQFLRVRNHMYQFPLHLGFRVSYEPGIDKFIKSYLVSRYIAFVQSFSLTSFRDI